jgi:hypothetical protein
MSDSGKHESEDLEDYTVLDANDTLDGNPGDDPLDRGVVTPDRWSAGVQYALKGEEESESLDELLAEEEPDDTVDPDEDDEESLDENATGGDVTRFARDEENELVARDTGIDGGGASAEEAAIHVIDDPDDDLDEDEE